MPKAPWSLSTLLAGLVLLAATIVFLSFAPNAYQIYLVAHVVAAVIWAGGDLTLTTLGIRFERLQDGPTLAALGKMGTWVGTRVYTPASIAALAFGIALMVEADLDWGQFWVLYGIVGWATAFTVGAGFVGPELGRIDQAAQQHGPESDGGTTSGSPSVHDLPLRHGAAHLDRDRHGGQAVVLTKRRPENDLAGRNPLEELARPPCDPGCRTRRRRRSWRHYIFAR